MIKGKWRVVSAIVLCFFSWTLAGGAALTHAAVIEKNKVARQAQPQPEKAEEKLARATEEIESILGDSAKALELKKNELKLKRTDIEALDPEIRKEFAATEKKLKDAKLPDEILQRHYRFVKHYDDNLNELRANLDAVEKAKDKKEIDVAIVKAKKHLERVKAPSRHQPLDPNNLPHRLAKPNKREPRMTKEEFERDLKKDKNAWRNEKRVMVASTGSVAGILPPDDLAETIEVQFTPEIKAKAAELGHNPVKIYEWVRNNIEFVPTYGSIQGAQMTLETRQGNAFDTASLLIAMLRASGIQSRYVFGTVVLPIDKVMNWTGGFTDPMASLDFMSSGGIPTRALTQGGKVTHARFEHVWVEAWVDYVPSRGAVHKQGDTWVQLDPSFKQYTYTQGIDMAAVPFDAQGFVDQLKSTATIDEAAGFVTNVNSSLIQQAMQDYQTRVQTYIQQNYPDATIGDVLGKKEIVKQEFPHLLGTLPYRTAVKGATFASVPDSLQHKLSFNVKNETVDISSYDPEVPDPVDRSLNFIKSLPALAGKKITLSYYPATPQDEAVINSYLPQPHADGTPIQPSEVPSSLPAYLINVKPQLKIDGQVVATGASVGFGGTNIFTMKFSDPSYGSSVVTNYIDAGVYQAIGLNLGRISQEQLTDLKAKLENTIVELQSSGIANLSRDDLLGDILYTNAIAYHAELGATNYISAKEMKVNAVTLPSETLFTSKLNVLTLWGIPRWVQSGGLNMDADYLIQVVKAKDGNAETVNNYMLSSGIASSALENGVPEQLLSTSEMILEGVSTVKAFQIANGESIPIYTVNSANLAAILPKLKVNQQVRNDVQNAVNSGKVVMISGANISYKGWIGCGYIIINPENGAGAYMISGGSSGADIAKESTASIFDYLIEIADIKVKGVSEFEAERYAKNFRTLAKQVGNALLFASIVDTLLDDQKTNWEKTNKILADIISKVVVDKGISMVSGINPIAMLYAGLVVGLILTIAISISMIFIARSLVLMAVSAED